MRKSLVKQLADTARGNIWHIAAGSLNRTLQFSSLRLPATMRRLASDMRGGRRPSRRNCLRLAESLMCLSVKIAD